MDMLGKLRNQREKLEAKEASWLHKKKTERKVDIKLDKRRINIIQEESEETTQNFAKKVPIKMHCEFKKYISPNQKVKFQSSPQRNCFWKQRILTKILDSIRSKINTTNQQINHGSSSSHATRCKNIELNDWKPKCRQSMEEDWQNIHTLWLYLFFLTEIDKKNMPTRWGH